MKNIEGGSASSEQHVVACVDMKLVNYGLLLRLWLFPCMSLQLLVLFFVDCI